MRNEIFLALKTVLGDQPGWVVVHSSMAKLAPTDPINKWDFIYAVKQLAEQGWTLVFPAFTFSFTTTGKFSPTCSNSETGILADWIKESLPDSIRTENPIYSFVAIGSGADELYSCKSETTFGANSPFELFEKRDAMLCMVGADWEYCTQFHRYEELAEVPYRHFKTFDGIMSLGGESTPTSTKMFVRDLDLDVANDFSPLIRTLLESRKIESCRLGRGKVQSCSVKDIRRAAMSQLSEDNYVYTHNKAVLALSLEQKSTRQHQRKYKIAILGSSNLDPCKNQLGVKLGEKLCDRDVQIYSNPFAQLANQILNQKSELLQFGADVTFFIDRLEDILGVVSIEYIDEKSINKAVKNYSLLIQKYLDLNKGMVIIHYMTANPASCISEQDKVASIVRKSNDLLEQRFSDNDNVILLDISSVVQRDASFFDMRTWYLGRFPFSHGVMNYLVERWISIILVLLEKTARLIVVDLDNTLWGGVVGEDGIDGIKIGGDYPGNCFRDFQMALKGLSNNGVAIAVCSKNDEDVALNVFEERTSMVLTKDDVVAHRINWAPKHQNIQEIAKELSLGLDSVLFIDDNPVEREAVRKNLPQVKVLDLPQDPAFYGSALRECLWIETLLVTDVDRKRVASYKTKSKIEAGVRGAEDIESFLKGLEIKVSIQALSSDNIGRAAQLCMKTNQFNTTSKRYSASDLLELEANGHEVFVIGVEDIYTEKENIGLLVMRDNNNKSGTLDLMLLSCRVLGRGIDTAVLEWSVSRSKRLGWTSIHGELIETERNTPVRTIFSANGFRQSPSKGFWIRENMSPNLPEFLTIRDEINER